MTDTQKIKQLEAEIIRLKQRPPLVYQTERINELLQELEEKRYTIYNLRSSHDVMYDTIERLGKENQELKATINSLQYEHASHWSTLAELI